MISVIVYGRNDSHGYNLPKRAALSFNCIAEVLTHPNDEIIFVDCNTPDDLPTFPESLADTLTPRAKELLRILRLRPAAYEKGKNGSKFKVLEPLCRNVGIRRTNPANRWILNTNTDMVFTPLKAGQSLSDIAGQLQDGFYELPRFEVPEILWETMDRQNPRAIIEAFHRWGQRFHLNEMVANVPEVLFDGPGDFQLALREQMFAIHGMNEAMVLGWHVDSNLCKRLFLLNGQTRSLLDHCYAYHCDHTRLNTAYHSAGESTSNDWRAFYRDVATPYLPEQADTWGLPNEAMEELRLTQEYGGRYARVLENLLPGAKVAMLDSALKGEAFNHGLLYDNHHVLPYVADHLTMISPSADIGYVGANAELLRLIAAFRRDYGHTGRILLDQAVMKACPATSETLPKQCAPVPAEQLFESASVCCFDFWMGGFPAQTNPAGFTVPKPSEAGGRFAALVFQRMCEFAKEEKSRLSQSSVLTRKALFLGTQNTWAEAAVTQLFNVVMTPYSSYTRHGFVRKDALERPLEPVPGHHMFLDDSSRARIDHVLKKCGQRVTEIDVLLMESWMNSLVSEGPRPDFDWQKYLAGRGDTDLERTLFDTSILIAELQGQFDKAERLRQLEANLNQDQDTVQAKTKPPESISPAASPRVRRGEERVIGVDARPLFDTRSLARGAGQYAFHHLRVLVRQRPDWKFLLLANETAVIPPDLQTLLKLPNVRLKPLAEVSASDIDLLHLLDPLYDLSGASPMDTAPGVPITATLHDLTALRCYIHTWEHTAQRNYIVRLDELRSRACTIFTISNFTRQEFISVTGILPERVVTIQTGPICTDAYDAPVRCSAAEVLAKYGIKPPFFLHVGSVEPHKNFRSVLQACGRLSAGTTQLVVVGQRDQFLKKIADHAERSASKNIVFTGFVQRSDLAVLYGEAVALLVLSAYDSFSLPALEAMAEGCPIIASPAAGIVEATGDVFLKFYPHDIGAISEALREVLKNPEQRRALGEKGRSRATQFKWERTAKKTIQAWEEIFKRDVPPYPSPLQRGHEESQATITKIESFGPGRNGSQREGTEVRGKAPSQLDVPQLSPANSLKNKRRGIVWIAPWQNSSGYAGEALAFAQGIHERVELELVEAAKDTSPAHVAGLPQHQQTILRSRLRQRVNATDKIIVQHLPAYGLGRLDGAAYQIGRTMFETDRLPADWVSRCNQMDEVWVPSQFNLETFAAAGVKRDKLVLVPGTVDENEFDPSNHQPLPLPNRGAFNFLFVGQWSVRKGWDTLLSAYFKEFSAHDDVCLYLRCLVPSSDDADAVIRRCLQEHAARLGLSGKALPRVEILGDEISQRDLPRLYKAVDCLVAPSRGEGWGRPQHEAMLMELPVIGTNWSATTEFMNAANSYLLDYELVETRNLEPELQHLRGHQWAEPSEAQLRQLMRHVIKNRDAALEKRRVARAYIIKHFGLKNVAEQITQRLSAIERKLNEQGACSALKNVRPANPGHQLQNSAPVSLVWEGSFLDNGSLSHVNREITCELAKLPNVQLTRVGKNTSEVAPRLQNKVSDQVQVNVRHAWPPDWQRPQAGLWVMMQPWEYGSLPRDWVKAVECVDEVWVYSEYVRQVYVTSGVPEAKVKVLPLGIDAEKFRPGLAPMKLATSKKFKFLFVGGTIHRKGPDVLLKAYLQTFTAADDVCLVIKDFGGKSVYGGQTMEAQIKALQAKPNTPEILYLNEEFAPEQVPALYAACDCLVHPYRGEGFGLPVLEAMACGLPVIVTKGGSTDDFAKDDFTYCIPSRRKVFGRQVNGWELAGDGWTLEPSLPALVERMRWVFAHREGARAKGTAASEYVRQEWTWQRAAQIATEHAKRLAKVGTHLKFEAAAALESHALERKVELPSVAKIGSLAEAKSLLGHKQLLEAWNTTIAALQKRPFHPEGFLLLAEIAYAAGDIPRARQGAERAQQMTMGWKPAKKFLKSLPSKGGPPRVVFPELPAAFGKNVKPRLSVCLIARNEEQFLAQCLKSVRDIASQLVLVDTGSTDRTIEIAKEFGAEVHHFTWCDDFSAARNAALEHARGDWVLSIDADEELTAGGRTALLREIQNSSAIAYRLPIMDAGQEAAGGNYIPRLFRNAPGVFFAGRIHEHPFNSLEALCREWSLDNKLGSAQLRHHGYSQEMTQSRDKVARNLALLERALEDAPNDTNLLLNFGLELVRAGRREEGLERYQQAWQTVSSPAAEPATPELRETLLTQFSTYLLQARRFDDITQLLQSPLAKRGSLTASLHFIFGLALMEHGEWARAAEQFRHCLAKREQAALTPINPEIRKAGPHHCLAMCWARLKQPAAAEKAFQAGLKAHPQARPLRLDFARFLAQQGRSSEALHILYQLVTENSQDAEAWQLGGRIALSDLSLLGFANDWTNEAMRYLPNDSILTQQRAEVLRRMPAPEAVPA